jgi:hypothetical protein
LHAYFDWIAEPAGPAFQGDGTTHQVARSAFERCALCPQFERHGNLSVSEGKSLFGDDTSILGPNEFDDGDAFGRQGNALPGRQLSANQDRAAGCTSREDNCDGCDCRQAGDRQQSTLMATFHDEVGFGMTALRRFSGGR